MKWLSYASETFNPVGLMQFKQLAKEQIKFLNLSLNLTPEDKGYMNQFIQIT